MTEAQIQDIYRRLGTLEQEVSNIKLITGTVGTSQAAIAQIYTRLDTFVETTNSNFVQVTQRFDRIEGRLERVEAVQANHTEILTSHTEMLNEILRILRDRNGGSGGL
jgi:tetrahydromethanopterin S-methyltransferase subunit G